MMALGYFYYYSNVVVAVVSEKKASEVDVDQNWPMFLLNCLKNAYYYLND
jgi:hypothetical protein